MNYCFHMDNSYGKDQNEEFNEIQTPKNNLTSNFQVQTEQKFEQFARKMQQNLVKKKKIIVKKDKQNDKKTAKSNEWSFISKVQYFCAIIKLSIENPENSISWGKWKQKRFFNYIQNHLKDNLEEKDRKTYTQCKSKGQNLKNKYFQNTDDPKDLLIICIEQLTKAIQKMKSQLQTSILGQGLQQKLQRYQRAIQEYDLLKSQKSKQKKIYEKQLEQLHKFTQSQKSFLVQLQADL